MRRRHRWLPWKGKIRVMIIRSPASSLQSVVVPKITIGETIANPQSSRMIIPEARFTVPLFHPLNHKGDRVVNRIELVISHSCLVIIYHSTLQLFLVVALYLICHEIITIP